MRLNWFGRVTTNNALRAWGQRHTAALFERLGGQVAGGRVLEVGCGRGEGVEILRRRFGAATVVALDLDPRMLARARRRLKTGDSAGVRLILGDLTAIPSTDGSFDAVFDFGGVHLEADWRRGLAEVRRVLRPGGRYYFEWVTGKVLRLPYGLVGERLARVAVPTPAQLVRALEASGFAVGAQLLCPRLAARTGFVGDLVGVGVVKASETKPGYER